MKKSSSQPTFRQNFVSNLQMASGKSKNLLAGAGFVEEEEVLRILSGNFTITTTRIFSHGNFYDLENEESGVEKKQGPIGTLVPINSYQVISIRKNEIQLHDLRTNFYQSFIPPRQNSPLHGESCPHTYVTGIGIGGRKVGLLTDRYAFHFYEVTTNSDLVWNSSLLYASKVGLEPIIESKVPKLSYKGGFLILLVPKQRFFIWDIRERKKKLVYESPLADYFDVEFVDDEVVVTLENVRERAVGLRWWSFKNKTLIRKLNVLTDFVSKLFVLEGRVYLTLITGLFEVLDSNETTPVFRVGQKSKWFVTKLNEKEFLILTDYWNKPLALNVETGLTSSIGNLSIPRSDDWVLVTQARGNDKVLSHVLGRVLEDKLPKDLINESFKFFFP